MKLQDQVCTLEQAKRLKELGVNGRCAFGYIEIPSNGLGVYAYWHDERYALINADIVMYLGNGEKKWYAPTVAELGVMLPHPDGMGELGGFNHPSEFDPTAKDGKPWYCMWEYDTEKYGMKRQLFEGATEAEARTAILIYFLEINLIQADEVNARLCS